MIRIISILVLLWAATPANAACEFAIEGDDMLKFNVSDIAVAGDCESVTINLTHTGKTAANVMGHNWVLTTDADYQPVAIDGMAAGLEGNYVPADDARVIAATKIIGGGESTSVTFSIADLDPSVSYTFFCSFPGHWGVMKGTFRIT